MNGLDRTQKWIDDLKIKDQSGRPHFPHGIWTVEARLMVYVLFDSHPEIGRKVFYFFTDKLQEMAWQKYLRGEKPVSGSRAGGSTKDTGAGYLFGTGGRYPDCGTIDRIEPVPAIETSDSAEAAVALVMRQLSVRAFMGAVRRANPEEDRRGIDIVAVDPAARYGVNPLTVEVKSRERRHNQVAIYLQISETNPDRRHT